MPQFGHFSPVERDSEYWTLAREYPRLSVYLAVSCVCVLLTTVWYMYTCCSLRLMVPRAIETLRVNQEHTGDTLTVVCDGAHANEHHPTPETPSMEAFLQQYTTKQPRLSANPLSLSHFVSFKTKTH